MSRRSHRWFVNIDQKAAKPDSSVLNTEVGLVQMLVLVLALFFAFTRVDETVADPAEASKPPSSNMVAKKLQLLETMAFGSDTANRIAASQDAAARRYFEEAKSLAAQARALADARRETEALELIDEGLKRFSLAAQAAKNTQLIVSKRRDEYDRISQEVVLFVKTMAVMRSSGSASEATLSHFNLISPQIDEALSRSSALVESDLQEALDVIRPVHDMVKKAIHNARFSHTVVYSLSFESPREEYNYEVVRNDSYVNLLEALSVESNLSKGARQIFAAVIARNATVLEDAANAVEDGNAPLAVELVVSSTDRLINTLKLAGLNLQ